MDKVKMFLFARWISMCYADEHCDDKMVSQHEPEFNPKEVMSVLNRENGYWWKEQLEYFERVIYPKYKKMKVISETKEFLNK